MMEHKYSDHPFGVRLGELIDSANEVQKLTNKKIACELGISPAKLSEYKVGKILPSIPTLIKLADYFGVSTDYLLGREGYELEEDK